MKIKMNIHHHFQSLTPRVLNPQRWLAAAKPKAVRLEVVAFSLLLMPVILVMADHLPFIDVPSSAFFHNAVSALYGARITTGTTPSTFSPDDFVTRGQMAVFLHRGLGRVAESPLTDYSLLTDRSYTYFGTVIIQIGGAAGGTAFVKVDAALDAYTNTTTVCPCEIQYYVYCVECDGGVGITKYLTLLPRFGRYRSGVSGTAMKIFEVPTATNQTFRLRAIIFYNENTGDPGILARGQMTAITVPFGPFGDNTLNAAPADQGEAPQGTEPDARPDVHR